MALARAAGSQLKGAAANLPADSLREIAGRGAPCVNENVPRAFMKAACSPAGMHGQNMAPGVVGQHAFAPRHRFFVSNGSTLQQEPTFHSGRN